MSALRVLIVDDEPAARARLRKLLAAHEDVGIVGECRNGQDALRVIDGGETDLVFLDIQMPGMDGFTMLSRIETTELPFVVFVTAYDRYALRAFEVAALDYLLKPFSDERFHEAMARVREQRRLRRSQDFRARITALLEDVETPRENGRRVIVRDGARRHEVTEGDIRWVTSSGNYVELHLGDRRLLHRGTLTALEQQLSPERFLRIHRRRLVNVSYIDNVRYMTDGRYRLDIAGGTTLTSSRSFRAQIAAHVDRR